MADDLYQLIKEWEGTFPLPATQLGVLRQKGRGRRFWSGRVAGLVLNKTDAGHSTVPLALVGGAYCKVTAQQQPIAVGDLLTTSDTIGYAMRADDPGKAFGSVIGKALGPLREGLGLIPILIALQ